MTQSPWQYAVCFYQLVRQLCLEIAFQGLLSGIIPAVVELAWVFGEVVQFANVTVAPVDRHPVILCDESAKRAAKIVFVQFCNHRILNRLRLTGEHWNQ